jgi:photosystem II stability/assembly factor-like uncharacterized protein
MNDDLEQRLRARYRALRPTDEVAIERSVRTALSSAHSSGRSIAPARWAQLAAVLAVCAVLSAALFVSLRGPGSAAATLMGPSEPEGSNPPISVGVSGIDAMGSVGPGGIWVRRGGLLLISQDGLTEWTEVQLRNADRILALAVPAPGVVVAITSPGSATQPLVVDRTTDAGKNWSSGNLPVGAGSGGLTLTFADSETGYLALTEDSATSTAILRTTDGGASWAQVTPAPIGRATMAATDPLTVWACASAIAQAGEPAMAVSRDGGRSWQPVSVPVGQADLGYGSRVALPPESIGDGSVAAVLVDGSGPSSRMHFVTTSDSGVSWREALAPQAPVMEGDLPVVVDAGHWLVAAPGSWFHLYSTEDSGAHWAELQNTGLGADWWFRSVVFVDRTHGAAWTGLGQSAQAAGALLVTGDGGQSWTPADFGADAPPYQPSDAKAP